eukprot:PhF_6_TR19036/c1_g1_i1/m.27966
MCALTRKKRKRKRDEFRTELSNVYTTYPSKHTHTRTRARTHIHTYTHTRNSTFVFVFLFLFKFLFFWVGFHIYKAQHVLRKWKIFGKFPFADILDCLLFRFQKKG